MAESVINMEHVKRTYVMGDTSVCALKDVSFDITQGEFVTIMGPSGSGKSTCMNMIGCLDRPSSGIVRINGRETAKMTEKELAELRNKTVGFVFQQYFVLPSLTVLENVMLPLRYAGVDKNESLILMKKYYPDFVDIGAFAYHQFIGAKIAKEDFGVVDEEILNAIMYHTTGRKGMSSLEKLIYAVDKIDPTRDYDSSELISAMENGVEEGFLIVLKANVDFLVSKHASINNKLTEECYNFYLK